MLKSFTTRIEKEYLDALKRYSKATGLPIQVVVNNLIGGALNENRSDNKPSNSNRSGPGNDHPPNPKEIP